MRIIATIALAAGLAAPVSAGGPQWTDCQDGIRCANLTVPVDWKRPSGPTTTIELGLLPATDQAHKRGYLVVNIGGPSTTIGTARVAPGLLDPLRRNFDVVMMDPRGLGWEGHVRCGKNPEKGAGEDPSRRWWREYARQNAVFDASCHQAGGPLVGHLTAWQVAHDLDAVRSLLGEQKLTYFGNSYGTVYAQAYLELFPGRTNRMFLDSVFDHSYGDLYRLSAPTSRATEASFQAFAGWCTAETTCALHGQDVVTVWDDLVAKAQKSPLPAGPGATVTATDIRRYSARMATGTSEHGWPELGAAVAKARGGNASDFLPQHGQPVGGASVFKQTTCADYPVNTSYDDVTSVENRIRREAPRVGWTTVKDDWGMCSGLRRTETYLPHPLKVRDVPPILLSAGSWDSATPPAMGMHVSAQLPGSRFLPSESRHAGYLHGDSCVRTYADAYLSDGTLPPANASCGA